MLPIWFQDVATRNARRVRVPALTGLNAACKNPRTEAQLYEEMLGSPFPLGPGVRGSQRAGARPVCHSAVVPGSLHDVDFMVKDSKRFADSATSRRRGTTPNAGSGATRS